MRKSLMTSVVFVAAIASSAIAFADDDAAKNSANLPMSQIIQNLQNAGYVSISTIDMDDNVYEAKVINAQGVREKIEVNPTTGAVTDTNASRPPQINILDAVKKAEDAGYTHIYSVDLNKHTMGDHYYEMKAYDPKGDQVDIEVNATTGALSKD